MSRRLAWQSTDDHVMERTAAPAKKELVISGDCKQFNVTWSADLVGGGTQGPNHTGTPLTDLDYV